MTEATTESGATRARILFVDDEPRILVAMKALFRGSYDVSTARSGSEAVEMLKQAEVDVVVSDQRMPSMTGVEVLRAARELRPRAIRVLLTGYSDLSAILGAINEGEIFRYINKPWSNQELRATIAAAVKASAVETNAPVPDSPGPLPGNNVVALPGAASGDGLLVLDDDEMTCLTLQRVLGKERPVYTAADLPEALDILERHKIGVIITEVQVAGEAVLDLLSALRQHHPCLVAIVLAGQADAGQSIELINRGQIYRFLTKPVSEGSLRGSVNLAFRRYEVLKENPLQTRRLVAESAPPQTDRLGVFQRIGRLFGMRAYRGA